MEIRQLECVVGVVDHGGFTKAAAALHLSQPALSQSIRTLETELGVDLFVRSGRTVSLTAAGRALVVPARQALRDLETARAAVDEVAGLAAGQLDLVCLPTLASAPVAGLIGAFRRHHPGVMVRLQEPEDAESIVVGVATGSSEVGCTDVEPTHRELDSVELEPQIYQAILPPGSTLQRQTVIGIAELASMPLITTPVGTSTRRLLDEALAQAGVTAEIAVETDHREVIADLVVAGAGAAILPMTIARATAARRAVVCGIDPPISRRVMLVHRTGALSPAGRAFVDLAIAGSINN